MVKLGEKTDTSSSTLPHGMQPPPPPPPRTAHALRILLLLAGLTLPVMTPLAQEKPGTGPGRQAALLHRDQG